MSKTLLLLAMIVIKPAMPGWAQQPQQPPEMPTECRTLRNASLTESACAERLGPGAPRLPECALALGGGTANYRKCAAKQPSDEILADKRREKTAQAEAVHRKLSERLKAANIVLPAGMTRLPTPIEVRFKMLADAEASGKIDQDAGKFLNPDDATRINRAMKEAREVELRAINAGLGEIVEPREEQILEQVKDAAERDAKQHPTQTLSECRIHLRLGMSSDQVIDNCGKPVQDFYQSHGGGEVLVYPGGAVLLVPPMGLSKVIEDDSWRQLK